MPDAPLLSSTGSSSCGTPRVAAIGRILAMVGLLSLTATVSAEADNIAVVTRAQEHANTVFSRNALQAIFGMRLRTWHDGATIKVFVLPDNHPSHIAFCKQVLRVFPHEMRNAWDRLVFSGTGQAPIEVATEEEMRARLAVTPGAIGYLPNATIGGSIAVIPVK